MVEYYGVLYVKNYNKIEGLETNRFFLCKSLVSNAWEISSVKLFSLKIFYKIHNVLNES